MPLDETDLALLAEVGRALRLARASPDRRSGGQITLPDGRRYAISVDEHDQGRRWCVTILQKAP